MKVLKFGGSSVANSENINKVMQIIGEQSKDQTLAVVVSAFGKTTDNLLFVADKALENITEAKEKLSEIHELHQQVVRDLIYNQKVEVDEYVSEIFSELNSIIEGVYLLQELSERTIAKISSFGERLSSYIIGKAINERVNGDYYDSRLLIVANNSYLNAQVDYKATNKKIQDFFKKNSNDITVVGGFIASNKKGETTTLGRGGSDFSAAILAGSLGAEELQIWTDVSGMFTANPKLVKQAFPIKEISYEEAMELSHFGAKVLYPPTIQPVLHQEIPIRIKNTFEPENDGTLIAKTSSNNRVIKGISYIDNISLITIEGSGLVGFLGFSKRLFSALSGFSINVVLITQASSEHSICVGIYDKDAEAAQQVLNDEFEVELLKKKIKPVTIENDLAIIAIVGDYMKNHQGLSGQMFSALGRNNVNVRAIAQGSSEKNISAVIKKADAKKALNTLHEQFFETQTKQLNLFVTGVGNVGKRFLAQIKQQNEFLKKNLKLQVRVVGISNSKKMVFKSSGLDLSKWESLLENGEPSTLQSFYERAKSYNLRNSVFVDNTANEKVAGMYGNYFKESISVVTCNKIAASSEFENYKSLKKTASEYNAQFLFETNVGAGLPIIDTLKHLIASGDRVHTIQAVLSGTLNYVFNNYDGENTFKEVVQNAHALGFTEPDPKIDLSGIDVARKILILARESGYQLDLSDVTNNAFLSDETLSTKDNDAFFDSLEKFEKHFKVLVQNAHQKNCRLKYVAQFKDGKASVGLKEIPTDHPFYNLEGSDNIVLFYTDRYPSQPLQIKGAGAGADVTASGIFSDIIRIANQ
jgi:aspartokinase/homoserine dehydrogenase 1